MLSIFFTRKQLADMRAQWGNDLGFVPTMGALHNGHASLFLQSAAACEFTISSVFVNPLQFNNATDLEKYPKTLEEDLLLMDNAGVNMVFLPNYYDLYEDNIYPSFDFGNVLQVYEGAMRPGHFEGVLKVLYTFFSIIKPNHVFFGQKDLQQCMVVEQLISTYFRDIKLHICPTVREESGLAMSSRNRRLTADGLQIAAQIYAQLKAVKNNLYAGISKGEAIATAIDKLKLLGIDTEYLDLIDLPAMSMANEYNKINRQALVFAGYLEQVRLIDNLIMG